MDITIANLPNWTFKIDEVSAGVYRVEGTHVLGSGIVLAGTDEDSLLREAEEFARKVNLEVLSKIEIKWRKPVVERDKRKGV